MTSRECVTHLLSNIHGSECFDADLWRFYVKHIPTTARTNARRLASLADPRVVLAEQRRERRESARRVTCDAIDLRDCAIRGGVCTPYPQPPYRAAGALET